MAGFRFYNGDMSEQPGILFTAFEPSGDTLAARLIRAIRKHRPDVPIYAMGGDAMEQAGATIIEHTTSHAAMLGDVIFEIYRHKKRLRRLGEWMQQHPLQIVIPTDSPAANWGVCKLARKHHPSAKILHLAAPQMWAWASWRVEKMKQLSDMAMCLLPFEPQWFGDRGVNATFVGHPLFEQVDGLSTIGQDLPGDEAVFKVALLPGSRRKEVQRNWPTMLKAYHALLARHDGLRAVVAMRDEAGLQWKRDAADRAGLREDATLMSVAGRTREVVSWADVVLTVSGTATLEVLAIGKPMAAVYNTGWLAWHAVGQFLVNTRTFTLPNLLSEYLNEGRVIDEWVPHFGAVDPVVASVDRLLRDPEARREQHRVFDNIRHLFQQVSFAEAASHVVFDAMTD